MQPADSCKDYDKKCKKPPIIQFMWYESNLMN